MKSKGFLVVLLSLTAMLGATCDPGPQPSDASLAVEDQGTGSQDAWDAALPDIPVPDPGTEPEETTSGPETVVAFDFGPSPEIPGPPPEESPYFQPCQDPDVPGLSSRPLWGRIVQPGADGGEAIPDYVNVSNNFNLVKSLKVIASVMSKASRRMKVDSDDPLSGLVDSFPPEASGHCICNGCDVAAGVATAWEQAEQQVATLLQGDGGSVPPLAAFLQDFMDSFVNLLVERLSETLHRISTAAPIRFEVESRQRVAESVNDFLAACQVPALPQQEVAALTQQVQDLGQSFRSEMGQVLEVLRDVDLPALRQQARSLLEDAKALWRRFRDVRTLSDLLDQARWEEVRSAVQGLIPRARDIAQQMGPLADAIGQSADVLLPQIQQTAGVLQDLEDRLQSIVQGVSQSPCASDAGLLDGHLQALHQQVEQDLRDAAHVVLDGIAADLRQAGQSVLQDGLSGFQQAGLDLLEQQIVQPYLDTLNSGLAGCHLRDTREACDAYCAGYGGTLVWLPNDYFKSPRVTPATAGQAALFVLKQIGWLDQVVQGIQQSGFGGSLLEGIGQAAQVVGNAAQVLANFADLLERLLRHVDTFTEGYHLGAYDVLRPRLHQCIGYAGHGTFAQMGNVGGTGFRIGARYTAHNLSRTHRVQVRTGGFGVSVLGRSLSLAPSIEINTQIEGWKLWDPSRPFGLPFSTSIDLGQVQRYDAFHLVDASELQSAGLVDGSGHVNLFVRPLYPTRYRDDQDQDRTWPRPEVQALVPTEGSSVAVFGAGLNLDPQLKPIRKDLPTIQIWPPWAVATPWFRLAAGLEWFFQANRFLDRILEKVNENLPPSDRLTPEDWKRDMHAFQAPDLSGDDGTAVRVEPSAGVDLTVGFNVGKIRFGITLGMALEVSIVPGGAGGIVDLNASLVDVLRHSNPPEDAPCTPVYQSETEYRCNNRSFRNADGQPWSTTEYSCVSGEEGSCCITIRCDPQNPAKCQEISGKWQVSLPLTLCLDAWTGMTAEACGWIDQGRVDGILQAIQSAVQFLGHLPFGTGALRDFLVQVKSQISLFQFASSHGAERCSRSGCDTSFSTGWLNQAPPTECERHGYCVGEDGQPRHDLTEGQCGRGETFLAYQCVASIRETLQGWEGAGCSPLQHGYPSACGCRGDPDCVEGLEVCDMATGRCVSALDGSALSCVVQDGVCPPGRTPVGGACLKPCQQDGQCAGPRMVCFQGFCRPAWSIPTAEEVVSGVRGVEAPLHAVSTYALSTLDFTSRFRLGLTIGARIKIFGKEKIWKLLEMAKAWDIGHPASKAWYQPGLEARYQHQCQSVLGEGVTNYFPHGRTEDVTGLLDLAGATDPQLCLAAANVCRYPREASFFGQYPSFVPPDQISPRNACTSENPQSCELGSFLDWCLGTMPERVSNPEPSTSEDVWQGVSDTVQWGTDVGTDLWNSAQLCINGRVWTDTLLHLPGALQAMDCRYEDPATGLQWTFPCGDLQEEMLRIWGCLDVHGSVPFADQVAGYPAAQVWTDWNQKQVLLLESLFDPVPVTDPHHAMPGSVEWDLSPLHLKPDVRQHFQTGFGINLADLWVQGVADCFHRRFEDPLETRCECQQDSDCRASTDDHRLVRCAGGACEAFGDGPEGPQTWLRLQCPIVELGTEVPIGPCCGDGRLQFSDTPPYFEECDDGNTIDGDGCSFLCRLEAGSLPPRDACFIEVNPKCEPRACRLAEGRIGRCGARVDIPCGCSEP